MRVSNSGRTAAIIGDGLTGAQVFARAGKKVSLTGLLLQHPAEGSATK